MSKEALRGGGNVHEYQHIFQQFYGVPCIYWLPIILIIYLTLQMAKSIYRVAQKKWTNFQMAISRVLLKLERWPNDQMNFHSILFRMVYGFMVMQAIEMMKMAFWKNWPSKKAFCFKMAISR